MNIYVLLSEMDLKNFEVEKIWLELHINWSQRENESLL